MSAAQFFAMGGYAWYVWGSFGLTFLFMAAEIVLVMRNRRSVVQRLSRMLRANVRGDV